MMSRFTKTIIAVNILVFVAQHTLATSFTINFLLYWPDVLDGKIWQILTHGFMHANLGHILGNMVVLLIYGLKLEPVIEDGGRWQFPFLYVMSILGSALGVLIFGFDEPTLGASGAVIGVIVACITYARSLGYKWTMLGASPIFFLIYIGITTFTTEGISVGGHLGGAIVGGVCGWMLARNDPGKREYSTHEW